MEKLMRCFLSVVLLLAVLNFVSAEDKIFGEGGELLLRPRFSGEITSIQWKHNNNLVAEWVKGRVDLLYYGGFKGRTTLDTTTGSLEIKNLTPFDSGEYSVEINNEPQPERYNAIVIKAVPKPFVLVTSLSCTNASEKCNLTCYGNTEKAEPVTYSWKMGGGEWMDGEKKRIIINNETIQSVKTFSCRMKNPISEEESDPEPNPFFKEKVSTLIKAVPKPTVLVKPLNCATASEKCTLTCDGNTEKAEPVTYSWKMRGEWMVGEKDRSIINDETTQSVKTFSCRMKNPISEEESDPKPNPFFREKVSTLIKAVPKPTVLVKPLNCATASEKCTLTCDGNTEKAEPVTYSWKMGGEWMVGEKDRSITNDKIIQSVKAISCQMKNPISEKVSDPKPNPFFREKGSGSSGVGLPVDLFLLVVGILTVVVGAEF